MIYGRINDNGVGRTGYSNELETLYGGLDIVRAIKIGTVRSLRHVFRVQELDRYTRGQSTCRKKT